MAFRSLGALHRWHQPPNRRADADLGLYDVAMGGHGVAFFSIELVAANPNPANSQEVLALNPVLAEVGHTMHGLGGYLLIGAVALHVVGALKHHLIDRDGTQRRMLGAEVLVSS